MPKQSKLTTYQKKRDFSGTPEPSGSGKPKKRAAPKPMFVVQKHDATHLHYDFRLEVEGVLKSWAVPKGPSTDPQEKRLAMETEDHPLAYLDFEGVIPEGHYGAGSVIVWDIGTYRNLKVSEEGKEEMPMATALANGHATFWLEGKKLRGGYALTRVATGPKPRWLLVKMRDDETSGGDLTRADPRSVLSGRGIEELGRAKGGRGRR